MLTDFQNSFTVGFCNTQQDSCSISYRYRILSTSLHYVATLLLRTHSTFSKLLMMFVPLSKFGNADWLLPVKREISGEFYIFQQDSTVAHRACETISLLERKTPAFISPDQWLPKIQLWTWLTTACGEKCSSGSTRRKFKTLMNWSSVRYVCRVVWIKLCLVTQ